MHRIRPSKLYARHIWTYINLLGLFNYNFNFCLALKIAYNFKCEVCFYYENFSRSTRWNHEKHFGEELPKIQYQLEGTEPVESKSKEKTDDNFIKSI